MSPAALQTVPADALRRFLMGGAGLLEDPGRKVSPAIVYRQIERMGFLQLDSINSLERAHEHVLHSRFDDYQPSMLETAARRDRKLFEHWTHDASLIPARWYAHWQHRFSAYPVRGPRGDTPRATRWAARLGPSPGRLLRHVLDRITEEGGLMSRDFEHARPEGRGAWWDWKPQKSALEWLFLGGHLAVSGRVHFHKVYDLCERVHPKRANEPAPSREETVDWACREALARLGGATPAELTHFLDAITREEASAWCRCAGEAGEVVPVLLEDVEGGTRRGVADPEWRRRLSRLREAPDRIRLLNPFDPALRDRARALRLFGFDYRIEVFVPAAKRRYGYYVLPLLEGERLIGRIDPSFDRDTGRLEVRGLWWEPGVTATKERKLGLKEAVERFGRQIGATEVRLRPVSGRGKRGP